MSDISDRIRRIDRLLADAATQQPKTTAGRLEIMEGIIAALPVSMQVETAWCAAALERLLEGYPPATAAMALTFVEARLAARVLGGKP
jgi:hypothetical protein